MKIYFLLLSMAFFIGCNNHKDALSETSNLSSNVQEGAQLYEMKGCTSCHGQDGKTPAFGESRLISQFDTQKDIENALFALRANAPGRNAIMVKGASNLTDQEILDLSSYIYSLK